MGPKARDRCHVHEGAVSGEDLVSVSKSDSRDQAIDKAAGCDADSAARCVDPRGGIDVSCRVEPCEVERFRRRRRSFSRTSVRVELL